MMELIPCKIPGCYELRLKPFTDERGSFLKTFRADLFRERGLDADFVEEYYTISGQGVLRGLHFQLPPMEHTKLVHCVQGEVMDVVVDLRVGSLTYGHYQAFELTAQQPRMIYIPKGLAHGFYVRSDLAVMFYKVTSVHSPQHDTGILWNSVGIEWPATSPLMSQRDQGFVLLQDFRSPFRYDGTK